MRAVLLERIADDGAIGPMSRAAMVRAHNHGDDLLIAFRSEAAGYYRSLIAGRPVFGKYENGWLNRAYS
jgi:hypothetical protein